jgi:hypothetical protein
MRCRQVPTCVDIRPLRPQARWTRPGAGIAQADHVHLQRELVRVRVARIDVRLEAEIEVEEARGQPVVDIAEHEVAGGRVARHCASTIVVDAVVGMPVNQTLIDCSLPSTTLPSTYSRSPLPSGHSHPC